AKAGDFQGALKIADKLKDSDWWKLNILQATAEYQAQRGEAKAARVWIGRLDSPLARAYALMGAAEGILPAATPPGKKCTSGAAGKPRRCALRSNRLDCGLRQHSHCHATQPRLWCRSPVVTLGP